MEPGELRLIVAVEDATLRSALVQALQGIIITPELLSSEELLRTELSGRVWIFLETSNDVARLRKAARQIYDLWDAPGHAITCLLVYATEDVVTDADVLDFWSIGHEGTVIVQCYKPGELRSLMRDAVSLTRRSTEARTNDEPSPPERPMNRPWWRWWAR